MSNELRFATQALHAGYAGTAGGNIFPPIHMGVAFPFTSGEHAERTVAGEAPGYVYARTRNPTNQVLEQRLTALEGAEACLVASSGLAATFLAVLGLMREPGDEFVTSSRLYGQTQKQFRDTLPLLGIKAHWVEHPERIDDWAARITPKTRFLFVESPSNPDLFVADLEALAALAHRHDLALVVDSTLATPAIVRPIALGADVIIHSTTKYLAGHSAALGGAVIGRGELIEGIRTSHHHYVGPAMSAFNAWLTLIGIETVALRMAAAVKSAQQLAEFLAAHPAIESVNYPGLPTHPQHTIARAQLGGGGTSLLSFVLRGGRDAAWALLERLQIPCHATHLGGNQSIVVHPATTTHAKLSPEERVASRVPDGLVRYSVGLEAVEDLVVDLEAALR